MLFLIVREREPLNLESPFDALDGFLTPNELFYVRNHFPIPRLDAAGYELRIDGDVKNPFRIGYEELRSMGSQTRVVTLECAGNSRSFLIPRESGVQWVVGAVGTAEWTGVPLRELLNRAQPIDGASEVVLEGADRGEPSNGPKPPGSIRFARSLPIDKAMQPEVLVAYKMNGADLAAEHGYPARAIVPGYYAMASVKWLTHIRVMHEPFQGYWQTTEYAYWNGDAENVVRHPLTAMMVKSQIARPRWGEIVPANSVYRVVGAAWSGESDITSVEVSVDAGRNWQAVRFMDEAQHYAWRRWECEWRTPAQSTRTTLLAKAMDASGAAQPQEHDRNYGSYAVHYTLPVEVTIVQERR